MPKRLGLEKPEGSNPREAVVPTNIAQQIGAGALFASEGATGQHKYELKRGEFVTVSEPLFKEGEDMPGDLSGLNGDIMAIIGLVVGVNESDNLKYKQVAVVDYGEDFADKKLIPIAPGLGSPKSRWGLRGLGDVPESHILAYYPLHEGNAIVIGRDEMNPVNRDLGLSEDDSGMISREHATIAVTPDGITIADHSLNNTLVEAKQ